MNKSTWEEKCAMVVLCWIMTGVNYMMFSSLIPEGMHPIVIIWSIWMFVGVPIIMAVAQKLGY